MSRFSWKAILDAAVKNEEQSYELYVMAQKKVTDSSSKKLLSELAKDELRHKEKLLTIISGKGNLEELGAGKIQDLGIVDALEDTTLAKDADYQRILVYAAKLEKSTYEYYSSIAAGLYETKFCDLFSKLAQEELKHKNKIEKEYDENVMRED